MLRRLIGTVQGTDAHTPPTWRKQIQYILIGRDYEDRYRDFQAAVIMIALGLFMLFLLLACFRSWTAVCYGCDECAVPENECGNLISSFSGDIFCTHSNVYLRPKIAFYSPDMTFETVDGLCTNTCKVRIAHKLKLNYTSPSTAQASQMVLNRADSKCLQLLLLFKSHAFNCNAGCHD